MQLAGAIQTGSDHDWNYWTITGTHGNGTAWVMLISAEIDGRDIEIDHQHNLDDEQATEALLLWQEAPVE